MNKRLIIIGFIFFLHYPFFSLSEKHSFSYLDHLSSKDLKSFINEKQYTKQFSVDLGKKSVIIFGNDLKENPDCIIGLYRNQVLLDSIYVMHFYNSANGESYYDENVFCLECLSNSDPIIFIVYCSKDLNNIEIIPINTKGLWGLCADVNNIYYSIEYDEKSIKRYSIKNKTVYEYDISISGGANIFKIDNKFFFNNYLQNKTISYELLEWNIKQLNETKSEEKKKRLLLFEEVD